MVSNNIFKDGVIYVLYVDDSIIIGDNDGKLDEEIEVLFLLCLQLTVEGNLEAFLGVNITKLHDQMYLLHQTHQIDSILKDS